MVTGRQYPFHASLYDPSETEPHDVVNGLAEPIKYMETIVLMREVSKPCSNPLKPTKLPMVALKPAKPCLP